MAMQRRRAARIAQEVVARAVTIPSLYEPAPFEFQRVPLPIVWHVPTEQQVDAAVRSVIEEIGEQVVYRLTEDVVNTAVVAALPVGVPAPVVAVVVASVMRAAQPHIERYTPNETLAGIGALVLISALATMLVSRRPA